MPITPKWIIPLTGMVQYKLNLRQSFPRGQMAEFYPPQQWVELEVEFEDEEAAKRLEAKIQKLLENDNMEVVQMRTNQPDDERT